MISPSIWVWFTNDAPSSSGVVVFILASNVGGLGFKSVSPSLVH